MGMKVYSSRLFIRFEPRPRMEDGEAGLLLPAGAACLRALWMLHRNEPGRFVFVEEHVLGGRHVAMHHADDVVSVLQRNDHVVEGRRGCGGDRRHR